MAEQIRFIDFRESDFHICRKEYIDYLHDMEEGEVILIKNRKFHHKIHDLSELVDSTYYKVWTHVSTSGSGAEYLKVYIFDDSELGSYKDRFIELFKDRLSCIIQKYADIFIDAEHEFGYHHSIMIQSLIRVYFDEMSVYHDAFFDRDDDITSICSSYDIDNNLVLLLIYIKKQRLSLLIQQKTTL